MVRLRLGDGGDRCFILYLRQGNVGYNCCKFVVILSSSLLAVKSMLFNVIRADWVMINVDIYEGNTVIKHHHYHHNISVHYSSNSSNRYT